MSGLIDVFDQEMLHNPAKGEHGDCACVYTLLGETSGTIHAVVWDRIALRCVHDPHPDRAGIIEPQRFYWLRKQEE